MLPLHLCSCSRRFIFYYCTILIDSSGGVTCDQLDKISPPASQHVTWDKPEILANCQNLPKGIICRRHLDPAHIATFSDIKYVEYLFILLPIHTRTFQHYNLGLCSIF